MCANGGSDQHQRSRLRPRGREPALQRDRLRAGVHAALHTLHRRRRLLLLEPVSARPGRAPSRTPPGASRSTRPPAPSPTAGALIPLVVQVGQVVRMLYDPQERQQMRRQPPELRQVAAPCRRNRYTEGDIPQIAISTGSADSLECLPRRMGVDASKNEYVPGDGTTATGKPTAAATSTSSRGPAERGGSRPSRAERRTTRGRRSGTATRTPTSTTSSSSRARASPRRTSRRSPTPSRPSSTTRTTAGASSRPALPLRDPQHRPVLVAGQPGDPGPGRDLGHLRRAQTSPTTTRCTARSSTRPCRAPRARRSRRRRRAQHMARQPWAR